MYQTVQCFIQSNTGVLYVTECYSVSTYKELQTVKNSPVLGSPCRMVKYELLVLVLQ